MAQKTAVRVRFAPSPTGLLHIGGLRTALYNYLLARQEDGRFILRVEDTDQERFVDEAEADILESLAWAGMAYDEGPVAGGDAGPYYQSQRKEIYLKYVDELLEKGQAYYAFDTKEELDEMRSRLASADNPSPRYDSASRSGMRNSFTLSPDEVKQLIDNGTPYVVRLKVPDEGVVAFDDLVRGNVSIAVSQVDDQVLLKSDGLPTYHLANVVDDHLMGITHIIRGEEWLPSTPKHILLYQAFGWTPPQMAHLPLILSPTGGKLSKRNADKMGIPVNVQQYRDAGYEPEALVNFLAMLGWNPGTEQEIFSLDELVQAFSIDRIGSAGIQFNLDKLKWYNQQYIKSFDADTLFARASVVLDKEGLDVDESYLRSVLSLMQERMVFLQDLLNEGRFFFADPVDYDAKAVKKRWKDDAPEMLNGFVVALEALPALEASAIESTLKSFVESQEIGLGRLMAPLRISLSGVGHGPDLFKTIEILGLETCKRRIQKAIKVLSKEF